MPIPSLDSQQGQPVRTINNGDVVSKLCDGTTTSQLLGIDSAGRITIKLNDGNGNALTSQLNGVQRALDIGINVAGVQIDPRQIGQYNSTLPTVSSGGYTPLQTNANGVLLTSPENDQYPTTITITAQDLASTPNSEFNQTWYTGTPTAGSVASFSLASFETVLVEITGTWTGTLQSEVSVDGGTNWIAHSIHLLGSTIFTSSFTGNVMGSLNVAAKTNFRIRATAAWTGSATVRVNESLNSSSVYVANAVKLVDGSSPTSTTTMNIVAASTAASSTNTAVVTALSPNSPLPAGQTGVIGAVNQGTSPWIVKDQADGPVTPGSAASFSMLMGGVYNTTFPTLTNGQQAAIQLDSSGRLYIRPLTAATDTVVSNQGTAGTAAQGWFQKITDGTNVAAVKAASTAAVATDPALVVALSPNSSIPAGTNLIGSVNQGTSPWITSDLADGSVAAGTAGTKSMLGGAVYNSTTPSLTNGQQVALQCDAGGNLKVTVASTTPGTPINNYYTSPSAVAYGSSDTHLYTITSGKTFNGKKFFASASGRIRIDVQVSTNGSTFTTVFTAYSSTSTPVITIDMDEFYVPDSGSGAAIQIIRYNEEFGQQFGISSTICGTES